MHFEHRCTVHGCRCRNQMFQEEQCNETKSDKISQLLKQTLKQGSERY